MKIAIDCRLIGRSGIGTYIENVVEMATRRTDIQFVLLGDERALAPYAALPHCRVVPCSLKSFSLGELFRFPVREVNECDAFFNPNFNLPLRLRVPVFCTIHDVVFFDVKGLVSPLGRLVRWLYIRRAARLAATVFTVSEFSRGRIQQLFHPTCPIVVTYSGPSMPLVAFRQQHGTLEDKRKGDIVFVGNLKKHKGIETLLQAFRLLRERHQVEARLTVIGNIDFRSKDSKVLQLLQDRQDDVTLLQHATNEEVFHALRQASVLVSPSLYEGMGLPPLEAMYLGTPAVISDIPVYREIYSSTNALFFPPGDAPQLAQLLASLLTGEVQAKGDVEQVVREKYNFTAISDKILSTIAAFLHKD